MILNVTVRSCLYPREEFKGITAWCKFTTNCGSCCGRLPFYPKEGMHLRLSGEWGVWHGFKNFNFTRAEYDAPKGGRELLEYVGKQAKGVGEKAVEAIYRQFGDDWESHIEELPAKWAIPLRQAYDAVKANKEFGDCLRLLLTHGGSPRIAEKAVHKWGGNACASIEANPYILAELDGVGFKTADMVAEKFGITKRDLRRGIAAVDYAISEAMSANGDSVVERDKIYEVIRNLDVPDEVAALAVAKISASGRIVFVGDNYLTTKTIVAQEGAIGEYLTKTDCRCEELEVADIGIELTETQVKAVRQSVSSKGLTIVNGGAGTGKTTIIKAIAETLRQRYESVSICAFAGKAAARVREATGFPATTIHSLLGYTGEGGIFTTGTLAGETIICDEASMIPSTLLYEIVKRNPHRLILVGDEAQLPPVGIGSPFHDIVSAMPQLAVRLDFCHRARGAILSAGDAVRQGRVPKAESRLGEIFAVSQARDALCVENEIIALIKQGDIDFREDCVIIPRNGEGEDPMPCTVKSLNEKIQSVVNPHEGKFWIGDKVMCVKNFPKYDIWNGTTGWIARVDIDGVPYFQSDEDGHEVRLDKEVCKHIVPAWAVTIHKSQGSQYRKVFCAVLKRDVRMFDRSMLYTAITRARKGCLIYCDDGLDRTVNAVNKRNTYLQKLIKGEL